MQDFLSVAILVIQNNDVSQAAKSQVVKDKKWFKNGFTLSGKLDMQKEKVK